MFPKGFRESLDIFELMSDVNFRRNVLIKEINTKNLPLILE